MHQENRHVTALKFGSAAIALIMSANFALAHCQIPCGIYDDHLRVHALEEDADTIEKSINELAALGDKADTQSQNQRVRWVVNKEQHAEKIIRVISDYFLTQRIKPSQEDYVERLTRHHAVMLAAMRAKQTSDLEAVKALRTAISAIAGYYATHEDEEN